MNNLETVLKLIDAGYTKNEIAGLMNPEPVPEQEPAAEPEPVPETEPAAEPETVPENNNGADLTAMFQKYLTSMQKQIEALQVDRAKHDEQPAEPEPGNIFDKYL